MSLSELNRIVKFLVVSTSLTCAELEERIGVTPDKRNVWDFRLPAQNSWELNEYATGSSHVSFMIERVLARVQAVEDRIIQICQDSDTTCHLRVVQYLSGMDPVQPGFHISTENMQLLARIGAEIDADLYGTGFHDTGLDEESALDPPFVELNFYFDDTGDHGSFRRLVSASLERGARFAGPASIHQDDFIRDQPFGGVKEIRSFETEINSVEDLNLRFADPHVRVTEVTVVGAVGTKPQAHERITYVTISPEAAEADHHPVVIWSTGERFTPAWDDQAEIQAGRKVYDAFHDYIRRLGPAYAAITCELAMDCPFDLRRGSGLYEFTDFYVSRRFLSDESFNTLLKITADAYQEEGPYGVYVSTYGPFNPEHRSLSQETRGRMSVEVARLIGNAARA